MKRATENAAGAPIAEAAAWMVNLQSEEVDLSEQETFADWLRRSPVHVEEFLRLTALRSDLSRLPALQGLDVEALRAEARNAAAVIPLHDAEIETRKSARAVKTVKGRSWRYAAAAAIGVIAVGLGIAATGGLKVFNLFGEGGEEFATAVGEQRSLTLTDGSQVEMNVRSQINAHVSQTVRDIQLTAGEALFTVAQDSSRPFRVRTPQALIEALGTQFNVYIKGEQTIVSLLDGKVRVTPLNKAHHAESIAAVALRPGEQIKVAANVAVLPRPETRNPGDVTAWKERRLIFENAPLLDVVEEFNRYSRQPLVVADPQLRATRITAVFDAGNARTFADTLAAVGSVSVELQTNGTWLIEKKGQR